MRSANGSGSSWKRRSAKDLDGRSRLPRVELDGHRSVRRRSKGSNMSRSFTGGRPGEREPPLRLDGNEGTIPDPSTKEA